MAAEKRWLVEPKSDYDAARMEIDSGATAVAIEGMARAVDGATHASWVVMHTSLAPLRALLVRLHYETWVKKMLMLMLLIQMFTFLAAAAYYVAVTAATFDEEASVLHLIFSIIVSSTTFVFVTTSIALTGPRCHPLIDDANRTYVGKRFAMNSISVLISVVMLIVAITSAVFVGFAPDFGFASDDDTDIFEGLAGQTLGNGVTLETSFDADDHTGLVGALFGGNIVSRDDFDELLRTRFMNFIMLLLSVVGLHNIIMRSDIYMIDTKLVFVRKETLKYVPESARSLVDGKAFEIQRARLPDVFGAWWLNFGLVACAACVAGAMLVVGLFPRNLTVMLVVTLSVVGVSGVAIVLAYASRGPARV